MPYLTSFEAQKTERTYRYIVQLASDQLDHEGVPETVKTVDVVVLEPTETAIRVLIAACGWLDGYMMWHIGFPATARSSKNTGWRDVYLQPSNSCNSRGRKMNSSAIEKVLIQGDLSELSQSDHIKRIRSYAHVEKRAN